MTFPANGGQPRSAGAFVQGWHQTALIGQPWRRRIALFCLACVTGCSNYHQKGPEAWYHENVGGAISNQRPPPPGENDPFPNLATVPPKPPGADVAAWNRMTAGLMTDRVNARQAAALAPIPAPIPPPAPAAHAATAKGTQPPATPPAEQPGASAALVGASAPPAAPVPAKRPAAAPFAVPANTQPPPILSSAAAAQLVANGQLPPLPTQEPPRPDIAPAPPAPAVPITATPPVVTPPLAAGEQVDFDRGSSTLLDSARAQIKALAAERGDRGIAITGFGDATSAGATEQSDALGLGLSRAQSLATALVAEGVPFARLRLNAESAGRGAALRLLE
jgi:outer membrane protein OmpA-like peptidoglycan-associated protein